MSTTSVCSVNYIDHVGVAVQDIQAALELFQRVFGTPLAEDAMTGVAIGMSLAGLRPIHVHIRMDFLMLAMNQLVNIAAKSSYMFGGAVKVPIVVRAIVGRSWGQGAQHSQALHSFCLVLLNLNEFVYID